MASKKVSTIVIIGLTIAAITITLTSSGALSALSASQIVPSTGTLSPVQTSVNIGIYSDIMCSTNATSLNWGTLKPGEDTVRTVYVKNIGSANATLSMATDKWVPQEASSSMILSWNREGKVLVPDEVVQATLTLTVSENIDSSITNFSFDVIITGTT
ncbi:MAG: hypothetical protein CW716_08715 [Candidatus Bathyarchaeum sp.]|nr:MAG: hypothetical protein CW716_08715 [Candidatus Bathyarchaeum sp.]